MPLTASIILPTHNAERFLAKAIISMQQQECSDFQFIIIDDGSTDRTLDLVHGAARKDERIVVLENGRNRGIPFTLNRAIDRAEGKYIIRMDADDISLPGRVEKQIRFMEQNPSVSASGTWAMRIDERGFPLESWKVPAGHREIVNKLLRGRGGQIIHPAAIIRTEHIKEIGGYIEHNWSYAEDYDLWLRLSERGTLANLPEILLQYRISLTRITNVKRVEQLRETERLCNRHRAKRGLPSIVINKNYDRWTKREHFVEAALRSGFIKSAVRNWLLVQFAHLKSLMRAMYLRMAGILHKDRDDGGGNAVVIRGKGRGEDDSPIEDMTP